MAVKLMASELRELKQRQKITSSTDERLLLSHIEALDEEIAKKSEALELAEEALRSLHCPKCFVYYRTQHNDDCIAGQALAAIRKEWE